MPAQRGHPVPETHWVDVSPNTHAIAVPGETCILTALRVHAQAKTRGASIGPGGVSIYGASGSLSEQDRKKKADLATSRCVSTYHPQSTCFVSVSVHVSVVESDVSKWFSPGCLAARSGSVVLNT